MIHRGPCHHYQTSSQRTLTATLLLSCMLRCSPTPCPCFLLQQHALRVHALVSHSRVLHHQPAPQQPACAGLGRGLPQPQNPGPVHLHQGQSGPKQGLATVHSSTGRFSHTGAQQFLFGTQVTHVAVLSGLNCWGSQLGFSSHKKHACSSSSSRVQLACLLSSGAGAWQGASECSHIHTVHLCPVVCL